MKEERKRYTSLPHGVEESNSIGGDAGDATSGTPENPDEWAEDQPIQDTTTGPLEPGDPSPLQPAAGSPDSDKDEQSLAHRARRSGDKPGVVR